MNVVLKCGGNIFKEGGGECRVDVCDAIVQHSGNVVVVHGGGSHIEKALASAGIQSTFMAGLRFTSDTAMPLVERSLLAINAAFVAMLNVRGRNAVCADGRDGALFTCDRAYGPQRINLGRVGRVAHVDAARVASWWRAGLTPVVAPLGSLDRTRSCNVNADDVAGAIAGALAVPVIFVSDVPGVILDGRLRSNLSLKEITQAVDSGRIFGGMIPKTDACARAIRSGAPWATIVQAGPDVLSEHLGTRISASSDIRAR